MEEVVIAGLAAVGAGFLMLVAWANKPQCPSCKARAIRFAHQRKDGGPDQRYKHNPQVCSQCGWTSE